ncbi:hypothetical protein WN48_05301 [Eufriesea mexicana]|uniref:Uncharacterized protein n=1 Tax=Eufriesea mexicana TaxID=516756 RepID=A0A310SQ84_9HYME|nr:PREDICTED: uncharacterized protein LOC108555832 [Eufriesea mexicana]OAD60739.1 hypothetical protein WN48_05301 [Eufriesea mexicana]
MPECEPWCPLVKIELKKIATEAPWILKKELPSNGIPPTIVGKAYEPTLKIIDEKSVSPKLDITRDDDWEKTGKQPDIHDLDHRRVSKEINGRLVDSIDMTTDTSKDDFSKSQATMISKIQTESATQWSVIDKGHDKVVETDDEQAIKVAEDPTTELSERERVEEMKKTDGGPLKHDAVDKKDLAIFREECDQSCPRQNRIRKLEERQSAIDSYLLNKGSGYFDDVCTCSLSCILRALKDDSFVRSILASVALFAFGLKLCSELNAWYLPIRSS